MDQASGLRNIVEQGARPGVGGDKAGISARSVPRVIAVTSGKGGVGKTNVVGNLAIALAAMGQRVVILDADMGLANVDIIFNIRPKYNIGHVTSGEMALSDVMVKTRHGISIIPGGSGFANLTRLTEGEKLNLLGEFETLETLADYILVDTGAGISSNVLYFNAAADECMVIATREPTSITDSYALMKVLSRDYGTRYFKLVVNMVKSEKDAKAVYATLGSALDKFLGNVVLEYAGFIPMDNRLQEAIFKRSTILDYAPESPAGKALEELASSIVTTPPGRINAGSLTFFMNRIFNPSL